MGSQFQFFFVCQKVSPFCHWQKSRYHKNVLNKGYFERFLHHFWYTSELRCVIRFFSSPFNPFFFVFFNGFYAFQLEIILIKNLIIESDHFILCCTAIYLDPPLDRVLTNLKLVTFYVTHCFVFNLKIRTV